MPVLNVSKVDTENGVPIAVGSMFYEEAWSFEDARRMLEQPGLVDMDFQFVDINKVRMPLNWEKANRVSHYSGKLTIIAKLPPPERPPDLLRAGIIPATLPNTPEDAAPPPDDGDLVAAPQAGEQSSALSASTAETPTDPHASFLSTCMPPELQAVWVAQTTKLKQHLHFLKQEDQKWQVLTWDIAGKPEGKIQCLECDASFSGASKGNLAKCSIKNTFTNFRTKHLISRGHGRAVAKNRGLPEGLLDNSRVVSGVSVADRASLDHNVQIVQTVNDALPVGQATFLVIGDLQAIPLVLGRYKVKCNFCFDHFSLVPDRNNLESNLQSHANSNGHLAAVARSQAPPIGAALATGRPGRPVRADGRDVRQRTIQVWYPSDRTRSGASAGGTAGASSSSAGGPADNGKGTPESWSLLCWGLWEETVDYGGETRPIKKLLDDRVIPGHDWVPEAGFSGEVWCMSTNKSCVINGLFRHKDCARVSILGGGFMELKCSACQSIKTSTGFRLRVIREYKASIKRGERDTSRGLNIRHLTVSETVLQSRLYRNLLCKERLKVWQLKHRTLMLQARVPSVGEVCTEAANQRDITKFCHNVILAHKTGAFGGKGALWDMLRDIAANLNRDPEGHRFSKGTRELCSVLFLHGGRRVVDCLQTNGIGPSLNSLQRYRRGMVFFRPGFHSSQFKFIASVYSYLKGRLGIVGPVPCFLAEDETCVKRTVRWMPKNDTLVGFCGKGGDGHDCEVGLQIVVGEGENGFNTITQSFDSYVIGHQARCVIVNPLVEGLPRLCLLATSTCGKFDAAWVRAQWEILLEQWTAHCLVDVGPLLGHASDGDARRRKLMLQDYVGEGKAGPRQDLGWDGWVLTHALITSSPATGSVQHAYGLHDQDFIHNTKKLVGPLDSASRMLKAGVGEPDLSHIISAYYLYKHEDHGLNHEDILRTDRQNWASAQRLCSRKVSNTLRLLRTRKDVQRELCHGTEVYTSICADYVDIFLNTRLTLRERVVLCAKVGFFFRLWRLWCFHGDPNVGQSTQKVTFGKSCIPMQTFLDIQMSVHFVVHLVIQFRDHFSHLNVPLQMTGSDACEQFFSKVGGMKGHERSYDFTKLVDCATSLNRLAALDLCEGLDGVGLSHKKHRDIWMNLHPVVVGESTVLPSQRDYAGIETNAAVVIALKEGFRLAQEECARLEMKPKRSEEWWNSPWITEGRGVRFGGWKYIDVSKLVDEEEVSRYVKMCASKPDTAEKLPEVVEVERSPEAREELQAQAEDTHIAVGELRGVMRSMFITVVEEADLASTSSGGSEPTEPVVVPTVTFDNRSMYKSTLISQLVGNPHLSKDRLTRVKYTVYFNNTMDKTPTREGFPTMRMSVATDIAVFFVEDPQPVKKTNTLARAFKRKGKKARREAESSDSDPDSPEDGEENVAKQARVESSRATRMTTAEARASKGAKKTAAPTGETSVPVCLPNPNRHKGTGKGKNKRALPPEQPTRQTRNDSAIARAFKGKGSKGRDEASLPDGLPSRQTRSTAAANSQAGPVQGTEPSAETCVPNSSLPSGQPAKVGSLPTALKYVWWLGRVQTIRKKYGLKQGYNRTRDYVDLLDRPGEEEGCVVKCNWFAPVPDCRGKFTYTIIDAQPIELDSVISTVILKVDEENSEYFTLSEDQMTTLDSFVKVKVG